MNPKKLIVVLVALLAGGAAFYLMLTTQSTQEIGTIGSVAPTIIQAPKEPTVRVLVAIEPINRGGRLTADNMKWMEWPKKMISEEVSYITDANPNAMEDLAGAVARSAFVQGEPFLENKIVRVGSGGQMAAILTSGMRAVALRVSPETASGGFILPGDRVDVVYTETRRRGSSTTRTMFRDVRVLAVNEIFSENLETAVLEGVNITLELSPNDAERLITARNDGKVALSLRSIFEDSEKTSADTQSKPKQNKKTTFRPKRVRVIRIGRS